MEPEERAGVHRAREGEGGGGVFHNLDRGVQVVLEAGLEGDAQAPHRGLHAFKEHSLVHAGVCQDAAMQGPWELLAAGG